MARPFSQKIALIHHGGPGSGPVLSRSRQGPQLACPRGPPTAVCGLDVEGRWAQLLPAPSYPAPPPPRSAPQWLPFAHTHYGGPSCQRPLQTSLSPLPLTLGKLRDTEHFDSHELYMWLSEFKLIKNELHYREFPGSLVVRTLCCHCHGLGSIPGWGTKIPQATWHSASPPHPIQKKKKKLEKS